MTDNLRQSTHRVTNLDGLQVAYHDAGSGSPLVLLHGSGPGVSAWSNFGHTLPVFAQHHRVIAPDLPGFGTSGLPDFTEMYSVAAARMIDDLLDHLGIPTAAFVGNSMGGYIATELAAINPARVERMVLMGAGAFSVSIFDAVPSEGNRRLFEFLDDPTRERMVAWLDTMLFDRSLLTEDLINERMTAALAPGALNRLRQVFAAMFNPQFVAAHPPLWTRAATISTPTLILWGRDDRMLPYDQAHFAVRALPEVELHTFARCGHWVQVERKLEFERIVGEFISRP